MFKFVEMFREMQVYRFKIRSRSCVYALTALAALTGLFQFYLDLYYCFRPPEAVKDMTESHGNDRIHCHIRDLLNHHGCDRVSVTDMTEIRGGKLH